MVGNKDEVKGLTDRDLNGKKKCCLLELERVSERTSKNPNSLGRRLSCKQETIEEEGEKKGDARIFPGFSARYGKIQSLI